MFTHFGVPSSEHYIAIELKNLKIKHNESYLEFYNRNQNDRSTLFHKINLLEYDQVKHVKMTIYSIAFLYKIPEDIIRVIRLKLYRINLEAHFQW